MYFFVFEASPKPRHPRYGEVDGAYVSIWVDDPLETSAEGAARAFLEEEGWDVEAREEAYPVAADQYGPEDPGRLRVAEAQAAGLSAVFHNWAVGAPEE